MMPSGWWLTYPSEKYESQLIIPNFCGQVKNVSNHQSANICQMYPNVVEHGTYLKPASPELMRQILTNRRRFGGIRP
jgi:hypothetical protein